MKPMKNLAQYYVDLLVKLGILRFSILLALALVALAVVVQVGITLILNGFVDDIDIIRSVFFGLLITPWAVYFLSVSWQPVLCRTVLHARSFHVRCDG